MMSKPSPFGLYKTFIDVYMKSHPEVAKFVRVNFCCLVTFFSFFLFLFSYVITMHWLSGIESSMITNWLNQNSKVMRKSRTRFRQLKTKLQRTLLENDQFRPMMKQIFTIRCTIRTSSCPSNQHFPNVP